MKKVRIVSTVGPKLSNIETTALTFGELKPQIQAAGYDLSAVKVIEGLTQGTLEQTGAVLPLTDFTLFIMPVQTKSGLGYKELRERIKSIKEEASKQAFKDVFGDYTRDTAATLQTKVDKWNKNASKTATPAKTSTPIVDIPALADEAPKAAVPATVATTVNMVAIQIPVQIPVSAVPTGIYSRQLTEEEEKSTIGSLKK